MKMVGLRELFHESIKLSRILLLDSFLAILVFFFASIITYLEAIIMRDFINAITTTISFGYIFRLGVFLISLTLAGYATSFYGEYLLQRLGVKGVRILSLRMLSSLYKARVHFVKVGDVMARFVSDLPNLALGLAGNLPTLVVQIIGLGIIIFTFNVLSVHLLIVALLLVPINYLVYRYSSKKIIKYSSLERSGLSKMVDEININLDNLFFVKRTNTFDYFDTRFNYKLGDWIRSLTRYLFYRIFFNKSYYYLNSLFRIIILLIGGLLVVQGYLTIGALIAFSTFLPALYEPIINIASTFTYLSALIPYLERYYEIVNLEEEPLTKGESLDKISEIRLERVAVSVNGKEILRDVNLSVGRSEMVAVVGPIGCGKTSLALTLLRFYEPFRGSVFVNGIDYNRFSIRSLRERIYYVPSKDFILPDSLAENLALGFKYSKEELLWCISLVGIDFANLETLIDPTKLSEGQKQKIALARAILRRPDVLILDEATNSLDAKTEDEIIRKLRENLPETTIIIISHRLTALRHAQQIYVMKDGEIIDKGSHDELLNRCSIYKEIVEKHQFRS